MVAPSYIIHTAVKLQSTQGNVITRGRKVGSLSLAGGKLFIMVFWLKYWVYIWIICTKV